MTLTGSSALPAPALMAYGPQLAWLSPGDASDGSWFTMRLSHAGAIDGALSALTPIAIVVGVELLALRFV